MVVAFSHLAPQRGDNATASGSGGRLLESSGDLLTTGEVAQVLGCSRQHVVDPCRRGDLPFVSVGAHRRVRRADVEAPARGNAT
jgi:excisionase family DNA binding protein